MKKTKGCQWRIFLSSAAITAMLLTLPCALAKAEKNSSETGLEKISKVFSLEFSEEKICLTVNDRKFSVGYGSGLSKNVAGTAGATLLLMFF